MAGLSVRKTALGEVGHIDASAQASFASLLSDVGAGAAARLLERGRMRTAYPGEVLVRDGQVDHVGVLIDGMTRTVVSLPDGRSGTIHYLRPVGFFGLPTVFSPVPLSVHVVRTAAIIEFEAGSIRQTAHEFPAFGWFVARQLAGAVGRVPSIIEDFGFKTVRQRVACHLIELSEPESVSGVGTAKVTQATLAEYVGSAREVVSRSLRALADEGLVMVGIGSVRILNQAGLRRAAGQP